MRKVVENHQKDISENILTKKSFSFNLPNYDGSRTDTWEVKSVKLDPDFKPMTKTSQEIEKWIAAQIWRLNSGTMTPILYTKIPNREACYATFVNMGSDYIFEIVMTLELIRKETGN